MLFTKNLALLSISVIKQVNNSTGSPKQDRKQKYLCRHRKEGDMSAGHLKLVSIAAGQRAKAAGWMPLERPRKILHHTDSTIHLQGNITLALTEIFPRLQWFNSTTTSSKPQKVEANLLERRSQQSEKSSCSLKSTQVQPHQGFSTLTSLVPLQIPILGHSMGTASTESTCSCLTEAYTNKALTFLTIQKCWQLWIETVKFPVALLSLLHFAAWIYCKCHVWMASL